MDAQAARPYFLIADAAAAAAAVTRDLV